MIIILIVSITINVMFFCLSFLAYKESKKNEIHVKEMKEKSKQMKKESEILKIQTRLQKRNNMKKVIEVSKITGRSVDDILDEVDLISRETRVEAEMKYYKNKHNKDDSKHRE